VSVQSKDSKTIYMDSIQGIIWDLDNTLYRLDEALEHSFNLAIAKSAIALGVPLTLEQASEMAHRSFIEYGFSGKVFIDRYDISYEKLHFDFHKYLDESVVEGSIKTRNLFRDLNLGN
jgi:putative hydrolase of the HAD superfamily